LIVAVRLCKARAHLANIPFIIVSAELGDDVRVESLTAGAVAFNNKPAKAEDLHALLSKHLTAGDAC